MGAVERVPVLSGIGVRTDGTRVLLVLGVPTSGSEAAWRAVSAQTMSRVALCLSGIGRSGQEARQRTTPITCFTIYASCERTNYSMVTNLNKGYENRSLSYSTQHTKRDISGFLGRDFTFLVRIILLRQEVL